MRVLSVPDVLRLIGVTTRPEYLGAEVVENFLSPV